MDLAPILTGIAVAGLICQATAVPVPFKVEAILPQAEGAPYATMAAQIGKDMLAVSYTHLTLPTNSRV